MYLGPVVLEFLASEDKPSSGPMLQARVQLMHVATLLAQHLMGGYRSGT